MLKAKFTTALVLATMLPALGQSQNAGAPPPPGPYQALSVPVPAMPEPPQMPQAPQLPVQTGEAPAPSATQIWGQPPMMRVPYWMARPGAAVTQQDNRQGGISPDAATGNRGGGQAPTTQLSPAGQPTAPQVSAPGYGVQVTPGFFPGYNARQNGAAQVQMGAGASGGGQAQGGANAAQTGYGYGRQPYQGYQGYPGYQGYQGWPAYPGYPANQGYAPYPGQMPVPYWGAPMAPAYPYPGQVNR